jgi:hypothetical protein
VLGAENLRPSRRISGKNSKGKSIMKVAQDLVTRKCDIVPEEEAMDNMTLQQYLDMYKEPLIEEAMSAIIKLKVAEEKKKMKKGKKHKIKKKKKKGEGEAVGSKKMSKIGKRGMSPPFGFCCLMSLVLQVVTPVLNVSHSHGILVCALWGECCWCNVLFCMGSLACSFLSVGRLSKGIS